MAETHPAETRSQKLGFLGFWKLVFAEWSEDKAPTWAAAVAYYTVFSLAPVLLISISIAGLVFGREAVQGQIMGQIDHLVGPEGGMAIQEMLKGASKPSSGILGAIIGFLILLWGASSVFANLQAALHTMWDVRQRPDIGIWGWIRSRFLSVGMVVGFGFILMTSLAVSAALTAFWGWIGNLFGLPDFLLPIIDIGLSFVVVSFIFAALFKYLPGVTIRWKDCLLGGMVTALFFAIGKFLLGFYLGRSNMASTYGSVASLVILLFWINYSAQILFFGAEFTQVWANRHGPGIRPGKLAEPMPEDESQAGKMKADIKPKE